MHFGLPPYDREHTLEEIAPLLNVTTREAIRKIQAKALKKMRHPSRALKLE